MKPLRLTHQLFWDKPKTEKIHVPSFYTIIFLLFFVNQTIFSQEQTSYSLGNENDFSQTLMTLKSNAITLKISETETLKGLITSKKGDPTNYSVIGLIGDLSTSTFSISKNKGIIEGEIILLNKKKAYRYYSGDNNDLYIKEVDINQVLCLDFDKVEEQEKDTGTFSGKVPDLQSLPGAIGTVYLDFDGEVVSGTRWVGGGTINAQPSGFSDQKITEIWRIMAEDFRPFNINITTNRAIYEAAPQNRRMMCIFTPTTDAAPGSGGVAYLNSFSSNNYDDPCWTYNSGTRSAGETGSHEVGHTLGLSHDGEPGNTYYAGHGQWSPIMGWSASKPIGHWSRGEYANATENEDDIGIISGTRNGVGYNQDDHGDVISEASELLVDADGNVNASQNSGLIATREDNDVFSFVTAGGAVNFDFQPDPHYPNLNIEARILNALGEEVATSNPYQDLSASISTDLAGGTYFIEIDGVGEDDVFTGYSDYSSIGFYSISGSYTPGNNNQPPVSNFEVIIECDIATFRSTSINTVSSYLWDFGDGTTSTSQNPEHTYADSGQYTVSLSVTNDVGSDTNTKNNIVDITIASLPDSVNETVCSGSSASLTLSGSNGYIWYDQAQDGSIITTGNTYDTPALTQNQTYYVSGTTKPIINTNVGIENIDSNSGDIHSGGFFLVFDAVESILLKKVKVSAQGTKDRTLQLKNANGDILSTKTINIPDGENIIDIDLTIPSGNNMQIGFTEGADLFRNNQNINYPYEVSNVVSIKESTASSNPSGFYYYLYDWQITTLGECETDSRTEITVTVSEAPEIPSIALNEDTYEITTTGQYSGYQWYLDGQAISGATNQSYFAEQPGLYTLEVFNAAGCSSISEGLLIETLSIDTPDIAQNISIYPNPTNKTLYINGLDESMDIYSVKIVNMLGQIITKHNTLVTSVDTTNLEEGLYFLVINNKMSKKFMKYSL
ncbi:PKD domain-containing protein [Aquimarina sp. 2201CG5-10]|uniref:PKD domain-containing protein n=1 Tax=Aquimarina callyspongiae TaxID=3098150 RepID=UPI002AB42503|nr:PKD domain-containing protein [Aquimarina sp. 2201CG5-10]MDY8135481.1 PKD domain-containing protein [Aquimarina sp. 2201CG5-10]